MKPYLLILAMLYCYWCDASCLLSKVSLDDRTSKSEIIIEGKVVHQQSFWNLDKTSIFTVNTIEVSNQLKNNAPTKIDVITPGGEIDGKLLVVEPNAELKIGSEGVFFLNKSTFSLKNYFSKNKQYEIYAASQGYIQRDVISGKYADPFDTYQNIATVTNLIQKNTSSLSREIENTETYDVDGDASISYFSPVSITAGTQSILTITGFGFKEKAATSSVQFRNANSTSSTAFFSVDSSYILSWSNTEIKVIVPGSSVFGNGGAGNGVVRVIDKNGVVIESPSILEVVYNQFEYKKNQLVLIDKNGTGGYTFSLNTNFNTNEEAKETFNRALNQWVCKTGVNASVSSTSVSNSCADQTDNVNLISFATSNCPLPAGSLGVAYSTYSVCSNTTPIFPESIDMIFSPDAVFNLGIALPSPGQFDFESVVLHELGHAFGQGHVGNQAELMYPTMVNGGSKRVLNAATDVNSVSNIVNRSIITTTCVYPKHKKSSSSCIVQAETPITAQFNADKIKGCAPLTVTFTDLSIGNPTAWKWDISNDGTVDYSAQNISHTFTSSGNYTIKLVAYNATSKDSLVRTAYITVAPAINMTIDVVQNVTCNGLSNGSLKANPTGGNGNYTCRWSNNQTNPVLTNLSAGNYNVVITDGFNCTVSGTKSVTQPQPISVSVNTHLINGNNYSATLNVTGGATPYTYTINNATITSSTLTNLNFGNYAVVIKDNNNCIKNSSFSIAAPTDVNEIESQFENLNVYPNPAKSNININISLKEPKTMNVELFDLSGQIVFQDVYENIRDKQSNIDLSTLANGTYLLKFGLPEGNTFRKIIIAK